MVVFFEMRAFIYSAFHSTPQTYVHANGSTSFPGMTLSNPFPDRNVGYQIVPYMTSSDTSPLDSLDWL